MVGISRKEAKRSLSDELISLTFPIAKSSSQRQEIVTMPISCQSIEKLMGTLLPDVVLNRAHGLERAGYCWCCWRRFSFLEGRLVMRCAMPIIGKIELRLC